MQSCAATAKNCNHRKNLEGLCNLKGIHLNPDDVVCADGDDLAAILQELSVARAAPAV